MLNNPSVEVLVDQAVKVFFGEVEGVLADGDADEASGDVVGGRMDAAPDARKGALIGGVAVGGLIPYSVEETIWETAESYYRICLLP